MRYRFARTPWPHQRRALVFLLRNRGGALQVPMRWGKTKLAIDFANCLHLLEGIERVLVVTPISGLGVWPSLIEQETPSDFPRLDWRIVNFESTYSRHYYGKTRRRWTPVPNADLLDFNADLVIVDESHRIGDPNTTQAKHVFALGDRARFRLALTGTMFHRKPFYVFGQMRFLDRAIFGTSFSSFRKHIAVFGGYGGYEVVRYQNLDWMMERVKQVTFIEEYVPPGEPVVRRIYFDLSDKAANVYKRMEKDSLVELRDVEATAPIVLTRHLRLQQIASGWLRMDDGTLRRVGDDLLRTGEDVLRQYADEGLKKVVIGCRFLHELRDAAHAARKAGFTVALIHGRTPKAQRPAKVKAFTKSTKPVALIAQMASTSEAVDFSAADTMLFWGLSESFVVHDQFTRRIERFRDTRRLAYDFLIPRGTRTEVTYEALSEKRDVADLLAQSPETVERITSKLGD